MGCSLIEGNKYCYIRQSIIRNAAVKGSKYLVCSFGKHSSLLWCGQVRGVLVLVSSSWFSGVCTYVQDLIQKNKSGVNNTKKAETLLHTTKLCSFENCFISKSCFRFYRRPYSRRQNLEALELIRPRSTTDLYIYGFFVWNEKCAQKN